MGGVGWLASLKGIMSEPRGLHCDRHVGRPYESVRALLSRDPLRLLQRATTSALVHSNSLIAKLRIDVARIEVECGRPRARAQRS